MITSDFFKSEIKNGDDISIKSILTHDKHFFYEQDIIDIYNLWQNNRNVSWNEADLDFKYYYYAKLPQKFNKNKVIIDCEFINEQIYFIT